MFKRVINAVIGSRHERERKRIQPIVDEINDRLDASPLALVAGPKDLAQYAFQHAFLYRYSPCDLIYSATASVTNP